MYATLGCLMLTLTTLDVLTVKTGGVYVPPFKLARMMAEASDDRISPEYQRLTWEALKKSLNGIINKVNITNIKAILVEVFREVSAAKEWAISHNFHMI